MRHIKTGIKHKLTEALLHYQNGFSNWRKTSLDRMNFSHSSHMGSEEEPLINSFRVEKQGYTDVPFERLESVILTHLFLSSKVKTNLNGPWLKLFDTVILVPNINYWCAIYTHNKSWISENFATRQSKRTMVLRNGFYDWKRLSSIVSLNVFGYSATKQSYEFSSLPL